MTIDNILEYLFNNDNWFFVYSSFIFIMFIFTMLYGITIVKENQRGVVFRLGKLFRILEPGANFVIPYFDEVRYFNLAKQIPAWQSLSKDELNKKITEIIRNDPDL